MKSQVRSGNSLSHSVTALTFSTSHCLTFMELILFSPPDCKFLEVRGNVLFIFFLPVFSLVSCTKQAFNMHMRIHWTMYSSVALNLLFRFPLVSVILSVAGPHLCSPRPLTCISATNANLGTRSSGLSDANAVFNIFMDDKQNTIWSWKFNRKILIHLWYSGPQCIGNGK